MNQPPATVPDTLHDPEPKITSLAKGHESSHHQNIKSHHKHKIHHGALSDESAGFMQTPVCLAISMGDLDQLAHLLETSPDFICERGPYGETILHIAILKKNADVAEWIVRNYGEDTIPVLLESGDVMDVRLVDVSYGFGVKRDGRAFGRQYDGQTALHQACKNGMKSLIELLVDKKVDANAQAVGAAFQEYSTNWEYPNLYSGSTPLHFAASRRDTFETVKTLVERGGADIYQQDAYGNNILHVMAYFGIFNETYKYIMTRNEADLMKSATKIKLMTQDNNYGLTPAMLGLSLGYCSMIEALKEPQWEFGDDVWYYAVPLDDICPILHQKKYGTDTLSKPILVSIVDRWDHQMITHPIFRSIIRVKWDLYARRYFIRQLLFSFLPVLLFTLSVNLDSGSKTQTTKDLQYGVGTAAFAFIFVGLYDVLHDYREVYQKTNFLPRHLRNLEHLSVWRTLDDRMEYLWKLIRRDVDEDFIRIVFGVCVILAFAMSTADRVGQGVDMSKFPRIQAVGLVFGWLRILYYARGIKSVGPLVLALSEIIAKGFMHWIVIYAAIVVGFSTAFYALMKNMDYAAMGLTTIPYDWNYYGGSVLWTVRFLFGMLDFDNLRSVAGDFGVAIFVLHQFVVIIVLLNVLIALLVGVFESVSEQYESQWLLQMARTVINIDRDLSDHDRGVLERQFGFHRHPVKIQKTPPKSVHPLSAKSLATLNSGNSLTWSKQQFGSTATIAPEDSRHFFMFLDQSVVLIEDGEQKTETTTVRLITGALMTDEGLEDVEVKLDENYWSFKKVLWDVCRLFLRQKENIWVSVGKRI